MPRANYTVYWQKYANPYAEPKRSKGPESKPDISNQPVKQIGGEFVSRRGQLKQSHLPNITRDFSDIAVSKRAVPPEDPRFRGMQKIPSILERIFMRELEMRKLKFGVDYEMQHLQVNGRSNTPEYRPDFSLYYPRLCVVEVQGSRWHMGIIDQAKDINKDFLEKALGVYETLYIYEPTLMDTELTREWFRTNLGI